MIRAAYHLGNRHVPVQLGEEFLRFQPDHVLAEMLVGLGCDGQRSRGAIRSGGRCLWCGGTRARRGGWAWSRLPADEGRAGGTDPHDPGHGPHRSPAKIHEFK
ncbi:MAG: hypothetical protein V5B44_18650 [Candidatus Accumulibacter necessarius]|uniref:urease accessory protein UreE n=1 Tax=Candidatus Accumulibacter necessarius TaxID=2954386 RepID=UPI002FC37548